jgi:polyhydroxyalkanoate synthesis regulator phasin
MDQEKSISKSKKRWIVREIESGRMTIGEAKELVSSFSKAPDALIRKWQKQYSSDLQLTLPVMTEKEKQKLEAAHKRLKELEKQLEDAQMKNIALETMIDIAEEQLKISIRKKSGPKQ